MSHTLRAAFWMIGAVLSFTAMAVAGRELGDTFDTFEIMMWRSAIGLTIVLAILWKTNSFSQIKTQIIGTHLVRNLFHFTGQNLWFFAVTAIPLAQVFALEFTTPLWVIVLSAVLLGERLTPIRVTAAGMGFVGILIVARPDMAGMSLGLGAAAICAIFFGLTYVFTKKLTRSESTATIMFYLTGLQLIFGLVTTGYDGHITLPDLASFPWLLLVALCGLLAHFSIAKALSFAPAAVVAPIDFARLPLIAIIAMLLYAEPLDIWVFVGAIIIFAGNYLNIWSETRKAA
ncbi:MAG: DMT family transporter [Sulfitobacter sp.]